jgi:RimJ/RimL family protein N-acetyltransferase
VRFFVSASAYRPPVPKIERLTPDHAAALLTFERENRAFFAKSIPDRGDDYFENFATRLEALLTEQATGACHFHVIVTPTGEILGRVNLIDVTNGSADLGFRIAEKATGQGLATRAVREICTLARTTYALTTLHASAATDNIASQTVLTRTGFVPTGERVTLSTREGHRYIRHLPT